MAVPSLPAYLRSLGDDAFFREATFRAQSDLHLQWLSFLAQRDGSPGVGSCVSACSREQAQVFLCGCRGLSEEPWPLVGSDIWLRTGPHPLVSQKRLEAGHTRFTGRCRTGSVDPEAVHHYSGFARSLCGRYQNNKCGMGNYCNFAHVSRGIRLHNARMARAAGHPWRAPVVQYDLLHPHTLSYWENYTIPRASHRMVMATLLSCTDCGERNLPGTRFLITELGRAMRDATFLPESWEGKIWRASGRCLRCSRARHELFDCLLSDGMDSTSFYCRGIACTFDDDLHFGDRLPADALCDPVLADERTRIQLVGFDERPFGRGSAAVGPAIAEPISAEAARCNGVRRDASSLPPQCAAIQAFRPATEQRPQSSP